MGRVFSVPKVNHYPLLGDRWTQCYIAIGIGGHNAILLYLGQPMVHRRMQPFSKSYIASFIKLKDIEH